MHHELLLALSGCPGNVFITSKDTGLYEVIPDLPFIHPSEVAIINKIVGLGTHYKYLDDFISDQMRAISIPCAPPSTALTSSPTATAKATPTHSTGSGDSAGGGLYLRALSFGIDSALDAYRERLVDIEDQCIADPCLPLSNIQCQLEEFQVLLTSLVFSVKSIISEKVHGCCILSFIHEKCQCGIPYVKESYERILSAVCQVFYKQLTVWMAQGMLKDQFNEFFIVATDASEVKESALSVYEISPTMKPSFISTRVAEQILFIGEAVRVFHNNDSNSQSITKISPTASSLLVDQLSFTRLLSELQENIFNLRVFESVCSRVRDSVAEHLWKLVVEEANLLSSLQLLKEFFLLGRGGLFLSFINTANSFMNLSHTTTSEHDVNVAFRQALVKMGFESETLLHQFRFTLPAVNKQSKKVLPVPKVDKGEKAWNLLGLSYKPQWPLHVFFTPVILEKYNSLFKFLLSMKRAHIDLHKSWHLQVSRQQRCNKVWELRLHMAFLLDNLQYYVQVDVLETQYMQLIEKINSSHDFEYINHAHEQFLSKLQAQLFFKTPAVLLSINEILELCHRYYVFVNSMTGQVLTSQEEAILERLTKEFHRQSTLLFRILSGVKSLHTTPHLSQLLLRVDYNKYFSSKMTTLT